MKFAHLADCHIGGWREPQLKELTIQSFEKAIETCINESVDFVIICGDLFDTALPSIELLKRTTKCLNELKEKNIAVYTIAGSHDFSPSGKTMLEVLEKAKLITNVAQIKENKLNFIIDKKTNTKIVGLHGKQSGLEIEDFKRLNKLNLETELGFKIFMFHAAIDELKPQELESTPCVPLALFPKNFNYYAGGHVHYILNKDEVIGKIVFPGPLFPNNFKELEKLKQGSFFIIEKNGEELILNKKEIRLKETINYTLDVNNKIPKEVEAEIIENIINFKDKIITLRLKGELLEGKPADIDFRRILSYLEGAYIILKNTSKVTSKEFKEIEIDISENENVEETVIKKYKEEGLDEFTVKRLMETLNKEKDEGEKNQDFEDRIVQDVYKTLNLEDDPQKP